ncbi:ABC transporter substrate-binding protein [Paenibacillus sp. y28]|uniref:ABC transporter substrate-binding protein n=1 Tax=Paenibacillus sp. y28 TaxID=3129110 RepID=UPI003015F1CC
MKRMAFKVIGLSLLLCLAGCEKGDSERAGVPDPGGPPAAETPVEIAVYSAPGDSEEAWNARYGNAIKQKFPHVSIKFINPRGNDSLRMDALLAAGETVDLYYESIGGFFSSLPQYKLQLDHSDLVKKYNVDLGLFEPSLIDALRAGGDGQLWGLPVNNNNLVLYYNKDIFDRHGVPYPQDDMSWNDILETAKRFNRTDGGKQYAGLAVSPNHLLNMNPYSMPYVNPETNEPTFMESAWNETWKKVLQTAFIAPANESVYKEKIQQLGNKLPYANEWQKSYELAMYVHQSNLPFINESDFMAMNFNMVSLPVFDDLPGVGSQMYPTFFSVTSMSRHPDTVFQLIRYLTSEEYQLEASKQGLMPVLRGDSYKRAFATETKYKDRGIRFGAVFHHKAAPISPKTKYDPIARGAITAKLIDLSLGKIDVNTALRTAGEESVKQIREQMNR